MNRIYYFFRRVVVDDIRKSKANKYPKDFFYGFSNLASQHKLMVSDSAESNKIIVWFHNLLNTFFLKYLASSVSLVSVLFQLPRLKHGDILFATVDSYGIALALLKKLGLLRDKKLIFNTIGLCDVLSENSNNKRLIATYKNILSTVDLFISGASNTECRQMARLLDTPTNRFIFVPFGIDTHYFAPLSIAEENFVLIIGADKKRDWNLYKKLFLSFESTNFTVITHPGNITFNTPGNVKILYNRPINEIRKEIARCKFLVILSKENYHFAGQSTAFRGMSMAKPVIFTRSLGVDEYNIKNSKECHLVNPGDYVELSKCVRKLNKDLRLRKQMGKMARKKIKDDLSIEKYSKKLHKVFSSIWKKY